MQPKCLLLRYARNKTDNCWHTDRTVGVMQPDSAAGSWTCPVQNSRLSVEHVAKTDTALPAPPIKPYSFLTSNDYVITMPQLTFLHTKIRRLKWRRGECQNNRHFGSQWMVVNSATRCDVMWCDVIWGAALCSVDRLTQANTGARTDILKALCHLVMLI